MMITTDTWHHGTTGSYYSRTATGTAYAFGANSLWFIVDDHLEEAEEEKTPSELRNEATALASKATIDILRTIPQSKVRSVFVPRRDRVRIRSPTYQSRRGYATL